MAKKPTDGVHLFYVYIFHMEKVNGKWWSVLLFEFYP